MHNYFLLSDTEKDLQMMVREFMEKEVAPGLGEYDEKSYIRTRSCRWALIWVCTA